MGQISARAWSRNTVAFVTTQEKSKSLLKAPEAELSLDTETAVIQSSCNLSLAMRLKMLILKM